MANIDKFKRFDALNTVLYFGKYKGETLQNVLEQDPSYIKWLLETTENDSLRESLETLEEEIIYAVETEREELLDMYSGYPDPMWD